MKVIIPVAGVGTRLRPHTHTTPKVLIRVAGKSIIQYILDEIINFSSINEIIFIVGYLGEQIERFIRERYTQFKNFSFIKQSNPLGLGHAIFLAKEKFINNNEPVFIILGDTIFKLKFETILNSNNNVIAVKPVNDPKRFGIVFTGKDGKIEKLVEKPKTAQSNLAIVGIYYIKDTLKLFEKLEYIIKNDIKTKDEYQLTDALQLMLEDGCEIKALQIDDWLDCGKPETLLKANRILLKDYGNNLEIKGSIIIPPVYIDPSSVSNIKKSIIGPYVSIGSNVIIEESIISDSIINDEGIIRRLLLNGSIIGRDAEVNGVYRTLNIGDSSEVNLG